MGPLESKANDGASFDFDCSLIEVTEVNATSTKEKFVNIVSLKARGGGT